MPLADEFSIAAGSCAGRDHLEMWKPNQDSFAWRKTDDAIAMAVADGCGSMDHSEVGSKLGVETVVSTIMDYCGIGDVPGCAASCEALLEDVRRETVDLLDDIVQKTRSEMANCFLFTIVGALMTPEMTFVFSIGDGMFAVNGAATAIGPFPRNMPPYLGYGLPAFRAKSAEAPPKFTLHGTFETKHVNSVLVGTDGLADWDAGKKLPGRAETLGPLSQFWEEDRYFFNRDAVRRRLAMANRSLPFPDWDGRVMTVEHGVLRDDTTVVVARRGAK